jgi:heme-degrading monooxygenase HmoA
MVREVPREEVAYIRYGIDDPRAQAFERAYGRAAGALEASEYCERYEVSRCSEDPSQYVVRIEWDSEAGHLSGFHQSHEFQTLRSRAAAAVFVATAAHAISARPCDMPSQSGRRSRPDVGRYDPLEAAAGEHDVTSFVW